MKDEGGDKKGRKEGRKGGRRTKEGGRRAEKERVTDGQQGMEAEG